MRGGADMKWFRKYFGRGDYSTDQELFANLYALSNSPAGMIMLAGSNGVFGDNTVYLRIPEGLAGSFPEYETSGPPEEAQVIGLCGAQSDVMEYMKMKS
jgi:hypothetical protein